MASRLTAEKNITFALDVLKEVIQKFSKAGLIIVGDGQERMRLEKYAKKIGVINNVVFQRWESDIIPYYKMADLFLVTSLYEGYGMTIIEALSSGTPVISSDVGIAQTVIRNGGNGFVIPLHEKYLFIEKINQIINDRVHDHKKMETQDLFVGTDIITEKQEYLNKYLASWQQAILQK
jgi:glycosyltransferase involved in cell wall biosynthesis